MRPFRPVVIPKLMTLRVALVFLAVFSASLALYLLSGFTPRLPVFLAVQTLVVAAPVGFGLVQLGHAMTRLRHSAARKGVAVATGLVLLCGWHYGGAIPVVVVALLAGLLVHVLTQPRTVGATLASAIVALILWLTAVQFLNYVILKARVHHLLDPLLWALDAPLYRALLNHEDLTGMFPIVRAPFLLRTLENAYLTLVVQPMLVLLLHLRQERQLCRFLVAGFTSHCTAAAFFLCFPTIGPTLYYPELFDATYSQSLTGGTIASMLTDLRAVQAGLQPVTGFGYFVALPSLHAAIATIAQLATRGSLHFWLLLPINVVLLLSTVLLGQHYIIDTIGGVALGWCVWRAVGRFGGAVGL